MKPKFLLLIIIILSAFNYVKAQRKFDVPLLIVGGGASGVAAGVQASREGVKTLIIEETDWLGGMLTSAGVSAIDGNHQLPSGFWGEFRSKLYEYYGGPKAVETGWVSNTLFEPIVGNQILKQLATNENLSVFYQTSFTKITRLPKGWQVEAVKGGKIITINAQLVIDATELGDVMAATGSNYFVGMDSRERTNEKYAPDKANDIIQDLTYVAVLKDFGKGSDRTIKKPDGYNPKEFEHSCDVADPAADAATRNLDCDKMLNYGKLPNGKYMINWPKDGNDIYLNIIAKTPKERDKELQKAKNHTLNFIYYIQTVLGYKNLGLSDEFGTQDHLPKIPYYRESRRLDGLVHLTLPYLTDPYKQEVPLYRTGAIVGDYTIDHHHRKNPDAPEIEFVKIKVPSYNVPLGALIPKNVPNFIVAEKSISVSNIVAGATRLQPVVLGIGQAAGALAAIAIQQNQSPEEVNIRTVQTQLINSNAYLMPFIDIKPVDREFQAIQKVGATGILKGTGNPYKWANQTWFYPNHGISEYDLVQGLKTYYPIMESYQGSGADLTIQEFAKMLHTIKPDIAEDLLIQKYAVLTKSDVMKRAHVAILIDEFLNPFDKKIDWFGNLK